MRTPNKRHSLVAVFALALGALPAAASLSPASAATRCVSIPGPTPSAEIDVNNDGNPEVRVPSVSNAMLCVDGDVDLDDSPSWWNEPCNRQGTCQRVFIHYAMSGDASATAQLCFSVDGALTCGETKQFWVPLSVVRGGTMCVGIDANGGSPCGGGTSYLSFS